jgi:hypothetical protein
MRTFVTEPLVLAIFSELLFPSYPVRYLFPYSSLQELYLLTNERFSEDDEEQAAIHDHISTLIRFFENPFVKKKIDRITAIPWAVSKPILYNGQISFQVINSSDSGEFGEEFDPIETELLMIAVKERVPLLIEDLSIQQRIIDFEIPIQVFDVADFQFALEETLAGEQSVRAETSSAGTASSLTPAIVFGSFLAVLIAGLLVSIFG